MAPDETHDEMHDSAAFGEGIPSVEDAADPETDLPSEVPEDAEEEVLLDQEARALPEAENGEPPVVVPAEAVGEEDEEISDVAHLPDVPVLTSTASRHRRVGDWECELSPRPSP